MRTTLKLSFLAFLLLCTALLAIGPACAAPLYERRGRLLDGNQHRHHKYRYSSAVGPANSRTVYAGTKGGVFKLIQEIAQES